MTTHVYDQSASVEALVLPRSGVFNYRAFLGETDPAALARKLRKASEPTIYIGHDYGSDILMGTWHKTTEAPVGVFNLNIKAHHQENGRLVPYIEKINNGDLIFLFMDNKKVWHPDNQLSGKLMAVGIVERVAKDNVVDAADGKPSETVIVSGADFGRMFTTTSTVFDQAFAFIENELFASAYFKQLADKRSSASAPQENVFDILNIIYNAKSTNSALVAAQWRFQAQDTGEPITRPDQQDTYSDVIRQVSLISLLDITTFTQKYMFGYALPDPFSFAQAGNVWSLMDSYANRVVNEMFVDVRETTNAELDFIEFQSQKAAQFISDEDQAKQLASRQRVNDSRAFKNTEDADVNITLSAAPGQPALALVHRQRPYDIDAFMRLPEHTVYVDEIQTQNLGYSSDNVNNFFRVRSSVLSPIYQELIYGIRVNIDSVMRFGLRRFEPETRYVFTTSGASQAYAEGESQGLDFTDVFNYYIGLLSTWYAANEDMLEGSLMLTRLRPEIRVGSRVKLIIRNQGQRKLLGVRTSIGSPDPAELHFYVQGVNQVVSVGSGRTTLTLVRGIDPDAQSLVSHLQWTREGPALPPEYNTFGTVDSNGDFKPDSAIAARVLADLRKS